MVVTTARFNGAVLCRLIHSHINTPHPHPCVSCVPCGSCVFISNLYCLIEWLIRVRIVRFSFLFSHFISFWFPSFNREKTKKKISKMPWCTKNMSNLNGTNLGKMLKILSYQSSSPSKMWPTKKKRLCLLTEWYEPKWSPNMIN